MRAAALVLPVLLAACVGGSPAPVPDGPVYPITYDAQGISVDGSGQRIDFGRAQEGVIQTMSRLLGSSPQMLPCDNSDRIGARWPGPNLLVFRNGNFVGWGSEGDGAGELCAPLLIN